MSRSRRQPDQYPDRPTEKMETDNLPRSYRRARSRDRRRSSSSRSSPPRRRRRSRSRSSSRPTSTDRKPRRRHHQEEKHRRRRSRSLSSNSPDPDRRSGRRERRERSRSRSRSPRRRPREGRDRDDRRGDRDEGRGFRDGGRRDRDEGRQDRNQGKRDRDEGRRDRYRSREREKHRDRRDRDRDRDRDRPSRSDRRGRSSTPSSPPPSSKRSSKPLPSQLSAFDQSRSGDKNGGASPPAIEKQLPNFQPTNLLTAPSALHPTTKTPLKHTAPLDARRPPPSADWRLYIFKGKEVMSTISLGSRSTWLIGRDAAVVDILAENESVSGQHAVLQFRESNRKKRDQGGNDKAGAIGLYIMDLESANGTVCDGEKLPGARYVEVFSGDTFKLGLSEREYTILLP